ncbi:MAG: 1,4-alpha-glucan branching protein GlgB [Clostridia bacterium]|nr:1,4-alpha-glucan branching protein GlgB [Clostridia bacterium]
MMKKTSSNKNDLPLYLFHQGTNYYAYDFMGAHFVRKGGKSGVIFRVWAPHAESVSVVGDFNGWDKSACVMQRISDGGIFETFIEGLKEYDTYKYAVTGGGKTVLKADPYAFHSETPPYTASKLYKLNGYKWHDEEYLKNRVAPYSAPVNIYEVNLASWKKHEDGSYYTYRELAKELVAYVKKMGYTHVEFMPVAEYPFDGSWGYQVTGYYAMSSRFGTPKDFMYLIDQCHKSGIGVIVDWVPAHFPKDEHGLYEFDGSYCYENQGWDRREHKGWGTRVFDWGRNEVQSFLISNAVFMFEKFHVDGLRVDAVASMLYLDYDKKPGEWIPNEQGGNYNLEAIAFFKKLNGVVFGKFSNIMMIAEESTAFSMITKPAHMGGLGFNFKWNMGWMNDTLSYMECDPYFRSHNHDKLTFSMCYAFTENYVLPISHDEVVHGKKSLIDKMHGDNYQKFCSVRSYMMFQFAHPGKKLNFMGNEFGQYREWDYENGLEFFMLDFDLHKKLHKFTKDLNCFYKNNKPLYEIEDSWDGFSWIGVDERNSNTLSFVRTDKSGNQVVTLFNFSGNDICDYLLGLDEGEYKIALCSDDKKYGGQGMVKRKIYKTIPCECHGKKQAIKINLPKFSAVYLIKG